MNEHFHINKAQAQFVKSVYYSSAHLLYYTDEPHSLLSKQTSGRNWAIKRVNWPHYQSDRPEISCSSLTSYRGPLSDEVQDFIFLFFAVIFPFHKTSSRNLFSRHLLHLMVGCKPPY